MQNNEGLLWLSFFVITGVTTLQVGRRFSQHCAMPLGEGGEWEDRSVPPSWGRLAEDMSLFTCVSLRSLLAVLKKHRDIGPAWPGASPPRSCAHPARHFSLYAGLSSARFGDVRCEEPSPEEMAQLTASESLPLSDMNRTLPLVLLVPSHLAMLVTPHRGPSGT